MHIQDIYSVVENEFETTNTIIVSKLTSKVPLVSKIADYIISSGGKRMRPLVVLLVSGALSQGKQEDTETQSLTKEQESILAAVIEFLHTATLLHDDVVDTSDMRRGKSTANAQWGNAPSVLVGDFLYARAFQMMVQLKNMEVMKILSDATQIIAEGEVLQLANSKNPDITEDQYFEVIENKTAMLFQAAAHSAAVLANSGDEILNACQSYGLQLGLAFQLIDDVLDYTGDPETMGKNVGDDLAEGKPTLPLIYAMQHSSDGDQKIIRKAIRSGDVSALSKICTIVRSSGALDYTLEQANRSKDLAIEALAPISDSLFKEALISLASLAVERSN